MPNLYIIAGPTVGVPNQRKTTTAYTLLPDVLGVFEFFNADEIARGLSPFNVESVAFEAGRIMLQRINYLLDKRVDFALETTLSTRSYVQTIRRAREMGYVIHLFFIYLSSSEMAVNRVANRVASGGHNIPVDVICRRYERALHNLFTLYLAICDLFLIVNNSGNEPVEIARGGLLNQEIIVDQVLWKTLKTNYGIEK